MAFFNTNPNAGQINQLNKQINQHLADINNKYTEIGRIAKLKYLDNINDPDVKRLAGEIDTMLANLQVMTKQINELKGLRECVNCKMQIATNVAFCPNCGAKQPIAQPSVQPMAPQQPMAQQPQPSPWAPPVQPVPQPAPIPQPMMQQPIPQPAPMPQYAQPIPEPAPLPIPEPAPLPIPEPAPLPIPEPAPIEKPEGIGPTEIIEPVGEPEQPANELPPIPEYQPPEMQPLPEPMPIPEPAPMAQPVQPAPAPAANVGQFIFCTSCGNKEAAGTRFCSECGAVLE